MKFNLKSITNKLTLSGIVIVILPLIIAGWLSYSKSESALQDISMMRVKGMAVDLANLTNQTLTSLINQADIIASQKQIIDMAESVKKSGIKESGKQIKDVFQALSIQFRSFGSYYQGIFVTDTKGEAYTGILDNGAEYKGINVSDQDYYQKVIGQKQSVISEVVISKLTFKPIVVALAPIKNSNGRMIGTLGTVIKADYFGSAIANRKIGQTGYGYMINNKGLILAHPRPEFVLKLDTTTLKEMTSIINKMMAGETGMEPYNFEGLDKVAGFAPVGINGWSIGATQQASEFLAASNTIRNTNILVIVLAGLITAVIVFLAARSIVKPINNAVIGLQDIAQGEGDLTMRLQVTSQDEVGELARWFNVFIEKLQGIIKQIGQGVDTLAISSTDLSSISEEMSQAAQNTSDKSKKVSSASEELSGNMSAVAAAMEESATNTSMVAAAAEEMSATISEIAKNSEKARTISDEAARKTADTSTTMEQLGEAAQAIGKVVETITDISEQVNLLALNATIEAARAGEAGKGFAVVANEIKELAKQTADATQDIKGKIEGVQGTTSVTVKDIDQIATVITEVNDVVANIATSVDEQSTTTSEIATNVSQAAQGIQDVNENVGQSSVVASDISHDIAEVNTTADEMNSSSSQVNMSAQNLSKLSDDLKNMVNQFKV
ncbi:MAG: methyl-accepting chemotaxis protein [Desulfobacteraceae bacterium]|nr:methyl-accepting chemotaxis protein [Desulfobacteraceae bacterium]